MKPTVFIVDDDASIRDALTQLLEAVGLQVETYADGSRFLSTYSEDQPGCLVLDMAMPGMSGADVQTELKSLGLVIPIIFLSGHGDIRMAVRAMQDGAVDFLEKPIPGTELIQRVQRALALDAEWRETRAYVLTTLRNYARLSAREREVMTLTAAGLTSKEIARQLGISPRTVEVHRSHVMHKMGAENVAELVSMAAHCTP